MAKILIADDEKEIVRLLKIYFEAENIQVVEANDGQRAMEILMQENIDIALVDIMMPKVDGYQLIKYIREKMDRYVPVIVISAKVTLSDRVLGMDLGADDYIVKPFNVKELYAKTEAMVKRYRGNKDFQILKIDELELNTYTMQVFVDGAEVALTPKEYFILKLLMENKERVFTRKELIDKVWEYDFDGTDRVVDNQIKKLRKSLGRAGKRITTSFGRGYKIS